MLKAIKKDIYLNSNLHYTTLYLMQYSKNIPIEFSIFNEDESEFEFKDNDIIKIEFKLKDFVFIKTSNFKKESNKVSFLLDREFALYNGYADLNFIVENKNDDSRISSAKIRVDIKSNSVTENEVSTETTITAKEELDKAIAKAEEIKDSIGLDNFLSKEEASNTYLKKTDANNNFVKKIEGKVLSSNDYTNLEKQEVEKIKNKVDKIEGKTLSSNDYTSEEKIEVAKIKNKLNTNDLLNKVYPIGSIYISTTSVNPSNFIGGTWQKFAEGRTLVGVSSTDTDFKAGKTGGEKAHTLTIEEIPSHSHTSNVSAWGGGSSYSFNANTIQTGNLEYTGLTGGGRPHNNLQPYIAVYMWTRTA